MEGFTYHSEQTASHLEDVLRENVLLHSQLKHAKEVLESARPLVKVRVYEGEPNAPTVLAQIEEILNH